MHSFLLFLQTDNQTRKASIIEDLQGRKTVVIYDVLFKGHNIIDWKEVEEYLKGYIGSHHEIIEYNETVYIGNELPDEYTGSKYTNSLKGKTRKAKANAIVGIPEMIAIATNEHHTDNRKIKHSKRAKKGWYRYDTSFAIPAYDSCGEITHYNVWHAALIVNMDGKGNRYLYDIIEIKKGTGDPCKP